MSTPDYAADHFTIATPEGITLDVELAGIGSRMVATIVDTFLVLLIYLAFGLFLALGGWALAGVADLMASILGILALIGALTLPFVFHVLAEVRNGGRTPGKKVAGIRVVGNDGGPVSWGPSVIRNLVRVIDWLPMMGLAGMVSVVASARNQRLGDFAAGTLVVMERKAPTMERLPRVPAEALAFARAWDVSRISNEDVAGTRTFLVRAPSLDLAARDRLASTLATALRTKVGGAHHEYSDEQFLAIIVALKTEAQRR